MGNLIARIDCDADPVRIINGFEVAEHVRGGVIEFDPSKVLFYQSEKQKGFSGHADIEELRRELEDRNVYNVHVLQHLLNNREDIPSEWRYDKQLDLRRIFFFGTIYRNPTGILSVWSMKWRPNDDPGMWAGEGEWHAALRNISIEEGKLFSSDCVLIEA